MKQMPYSYSQFENYLGKLWVKQAIRLSPLCMAGAAHWLLLARTATLTPLGRFADTVSPLLRACVLGDNRVLVG